MKKSVCSLLLVLLLLTGCSAAEKEPSNPPEEAESQQAQTKTEEIKSASRDVFAMDTYITITCCGEQCEKALDAAVAEIQRLDALLSVGDPNSEISRINETGYGSLSEEAATMVEKSLELYDSTDGAFDITVFPLMELWGFTSGAFVVPEEGELTDILAHVGSDRLGYDSVAAEITLGQEQGIDLGGIAKGFTSDRLMEIFEDYDLVYGIVSLGGNVQFYGTKPDGSLWRCGIVDPFDADGGGMMGVLRVRDGAVITSGAYERNFTDENGRLYHHILNPATGYPAENGLVSVTIVSESGMLADGLSTSCYVMGLEAAAQFWRDSAEDFDMILMTEDGNVYITAPLRERYATEYPLYVISESGEIQEGP